MTSRSLATLLVCAGVALPISARADGLTTKHGPGSKMTQTTGTGAMQAQAQSAPLVMGKAPLSLSQTVAVTEKGHFDFMSGDAAMGRLFAAHPGAKALTVLDLASGQVRSIDTGQVNCAVVDEADQKVFAAGGDQKVVVLDRKTLSKTAEIPLSGPADAIALDTKRSRLYVDHDDGAEVWVVNARTNVLEGRVVLSGVPEYLLYDAASDRLFQNIKDKDEIEVINPATNTVVAHFPTAPLKSPHGLAINPQTHRLFVAGNGKVAVLDSRDGHLITSLDITPGYVDQIAFDPASQRLYCACGAGTVAVVQETATGATFLGTVATPNRTHTLTVDPRGDVWVAADTPTGDTLLHFTPKHVAR